MLDKLRVRERTPREQEQVSLFRRSFFVYATTFFCLGMTAYLALWGDRTGFTERIVSELISFASLMAMLYVGAGVIDRTGLVNRVADRMSEGMGQRYGERDAYGDQYGRPPYARPYDPPAQPVVQPPSNQSDER